MNHQKIYNSLIVRALERIRDPNTYYEKHHIIPRSLGGDDSRSNLVYLTGREHFIAHMLLANIYGGGMWQAAKMMKNSRKCQDRSFNSRLYEIAKREWSNFLKGRKRPEHVIDALKKSARTRVVSQKTREKMSQNRKGKPRAGDPTKWKHSDESKEKMSQSHIKANTGARLPKMYGENNPMKRPENRAKISEAKKAYWAKIREQKLLSTQE